MSFLLKRALRAFLISKDPIWRGVRRIFLRAGAALFAPTVFNRFEKAPMSLFLVRVAKRAGSYRVSRPLLDFTRSEVTFSRL